MTDEALIQAMLSNDCRSAPTAFDVKGDMRHNSVSSTKTYLADAATYFELVSSSSTDPKDLQVGRYRGIFVKDVSIARSVIGHQNKMSLPELSRWYVFDVLKVDPKKHSILEVFDLACKPSIASKSLCGTQRYLFDMLGSTKYQLYLKYDREEKKKEETNLLSKSKKAQKLHPS